MTPVRFVGAVVLTCAGVLIVLGVCVFTVGSVVS